MDKTKNKNTRHHAQVIEIYPEQNFAAVKFRHRNKDRVECVELRKLEVGTYGWISFYMTPTRGWWVFEEKASAAGEIAHADSIAKILTGGDHE